ncbi:MAG: N-6 DNA methylase, partial [Ignavibacteriaceae bacterium]
MSTYLVKEYQAEVERIIQYGGSHNEGAISGAFYKLLNEYCRTKNLFLVPQLEFKTKEDKIVKPDGTVKDTLRLDWGYWESKDKDDDLDKEIDDKISKGYPTSNILFEDSQKVILIQHGVRCKEADVNDADALDELLTKFVNYERPEIRDFREAIEKFKEDIPTVVDTLRQMIENEEKSNKKFKESADNFLAICHESINPIMIMADIREMMIQHILTEEIFLTVFNESQFHRENNIAVELDKVVDTFFTGRTKRETLEKVDNYYKVIKRTATDIYNHQEKQRFLKVIYENFYKAYNIKAADRLGIIYTPNEIVRFMIESTDYLLHTHFGKFMYDKDVEILDPFTGTGTFVTEIIDFLPKNKLEYKYKNEIHCNEVAILPYYIANLNIEYTYKQKMGVYEEFNNICFVDTLDNISFAYKDQQVGLDFGLGVENAER